MHLFYSPNVEALYLASTRRARLRRACDRRRDYLASTRRARLRRACDRR
jgi:hypothetical protein